MAEQLTSTPSALAYSNFYKACKSPSTKISYPKGVNSFMGYLGMMPGQYDKLLEMDPKTIQTYIINYITYLDDNHKAPATISMYVAAIAKFYVMNDVISLNWKKIRSYEPEDEGVAEDRPYTHDEIKSLLDKTSPRNRAIILLMSSTGMRVGAVPQLRIRDLEPHDNYSIYKIHVYPKSKKHNYKTYCSPECRKAIDSFIEYRKRFGERITDDSPLFRRDYGVRGKQQRDVKKITRETIIRFMMVLVRDVGLRGIPLENQGHKRADIMLSHGFRKFYETNAFKAGMDHIYIRRLLGQKSGLEDAYLKLKEEELLEGDSRHTGYIGIIDQLTISEENKLRRKVKTLTEKQDEIQKIKNKHDQEMKSIREEMNKQFGQVMEMIQRNPQLANVKPEVLVNRKTNSQPV